MDFGFLDNRPIVVAVAGSNGAGKTTFFHSHLAETGLRFVNSDDLAVELDVPAHEAAEIASAVRRALAEKQESFVFETVFSDPVGDKVKFLKDCADAGYEVALIFIRIADVETSIERVSIRVAQGGHDVPDEKLRDRFARTLQNLDRAVQALPHVLVYDNSDLTKPFQLVAAWEDGRPVEIH